MTRGVFRTLSNNNRSFCRNSWWVNGLFLQKVIPSKMFYWVLNTPQITTSLAVSLLPKILRSISCTSYLYQHSIDFWINMAGNKYKWTRKFENVRNFIKCTLQHIPNMLHYGIYSPFRSNKTAQRDSQRCTKLHNEVHNVLKIY